MPPKVKLTEEERIQLFELSHLANCQGRHSLAHDLSMMSAKTELSEPEYLKFKELADANR